MKRLQVKALWLLSLKERKGLETTFSLKKNLIKGANDVGKSHLIKSLFYSLGAEVKFDSEWIEAGVKTLVEFVVNDVNYTLYRDGSLFALFDSDNNLILKTTSITNDLSPKLAEIFDFHLYLAGQNGQSSLATPAFLFLPFYIDQDKGWGKSFSSFENLQQFRAFRVPTIEYHTGIRPKEYYKLSIEKSRLSLERDTLEREIQLLDSTWLEQRRKQKESGDLEVNVDDFKKDIEELLERLNRLKENQQKYKWNILKLNELKVVYQHQLAELRDGIKGRDSDLDFLKTAPKHIECPLCKTEFENEFENRLEVAADIGDLKGYESELLQQYTDIERKINLEKDKVEDIEILSNELEKILSEKKKKVLFQDYVKYEGRKEFIKELQSTIHDKKETQAEKIQNIKDITKEMKQYEDKKRISEIKNDFFMKMKSSLNFLDVKMKEDYYKDPASNKLDKSGSDKPRALLAYYFSIMSLIRKYSTTSFCPLIIDSPNQQDQDEVNSPKMIEFILNNCEQDDQLILGAVDVHGVEFDGKIIEPKEKHSLLSKDEFEKTVKKFDTFTSLLD
ncbi:hypothetical protein BALOs_2747 [Halobacteriovorax sp. BALOs_7]|uniref:hypothetical protein n=1 Tax=Halobacteriovorax sp. BALOs_7 TaxID=2109558 RepID=UPI000EA31D2B|nr:hypothetical protein [Halobacteriovorax sp. BALOs_7]AYF45737.1 hypothetical protein BALOs_2747 [Halobacteriovorax sp. BALOs_7]